MALREWIPWCWSMPLPSAWHTRRKSCARSAKLRWQSFLMLPALSWDPKRGWGFQLAAHNIDPVHVKWLLIFNKPFSELKYFDFARRASCHSFPTLWSVCVRVAMSRLGMPSLVEWCLSSSSWRDCHLFGCCRTNSPSSRLCSLSWWTSLAR